MQFFIDTLTKWNFFSKSSRSRTGCRFGTFWAGAVAALFLLAPIPAGAIDGGSVGSGFSNMTTILNGRIQERTIKKWVESHNLTRYNNIPRELSIRYTNPRVKITYELIPDPDEKYKVRVKKVEPLVR